MTSNFIIMWLLIIIICIILTTLGIMMCNKNNAFGLIPLFLGLFLLGLVIGLVILYNKKQKQLENTNKLENET